LSHRQVVKKRRRVIPGGTGGNQRGRIPDPGHTGKRAHAFECEAKECWWSTKRSTIALKGMVSY